MLRVFTGIILTTFALGQLSSCKNRTKNSSEAKESRIHKCADVTYSVNSKYRTDLVNYLIGNYRKAGDNTTMIECSISGRDRFFCSATPTANTGNSFQQEDITGTVTIAGEIEEIINNFNRERKFPTDLTPRLLNEGTSCPKTSPCADVTYSVDPNHRDNMMAFLIDNYLSAGDDNTAIECNPIGTDRFFCAASPTVNTGKLFPEEDIVATMSISGEIEGIINEYMRKNPNYPTNRSPRVIPPQGTSCPRANQ